MEVQTLSSNAVVLGSIVVRSAMEAVVAKTAIVAAKSVAWSLLMIGMMPNGADLLCEEPATCGRFPFAQLYAVKKPGPENKDGSDTEDDDEDDDDDAAEDQDDDGGEEEDGSGEEGEDEGDPEDEPEANGDGGSGDEDDDDDDDGEEEEDEDEDEEEDDEDEEEIPQPPTKKRK